MPATVKDDLYVEGRVDSTLSGSLIGVLSVMPEPSELYDGLTVVYSGDDTEYYAKWSVYRCGMVDGVYRWVLLVSRIDALWERIDSAVPNTTCINGHELTGDIDLTCGDIGAMPADTAIPKKVSDLQNDGVFITQDVSTLANYYTKEQADGLVGVYTRIIPVDALPTEGIDAYALYSVKAEAGRNLYYRVAGNWIAVYSGEKASIINDWSYASTDNMPSGTLAKSTLDTKTDKAMAIPVWDSTVEYAENATVVHEHVVYVSVTAGANLNHNPAKDTSGHYWNEVQGRGVSGSVVSAIAVVGDGAVTEYEVYHGFKTMDLHVSARTNAIPSQAVDFTLSFTDMNRLSVGFQTPPSENSVIINIIGVAPEGSGTTP